VLFDVASCRKRRRSGAERRVLGTTSMSPFEILLVSLVAVVVGLLGHRLVRPGPRELCIASLFGLLGALLGVGLARLTFLPEPLPLKLGADTFPLVWSLWGALILVAIGTAVRGSRT
jgi:uncharacterized membrane protein YeaQ/YmgE (transglycosylase-associated protein family)